MFTDGGGYILLYNNRVTQTLDPMGYSPTTTGNGTGGTPGGGCTALGHNAIVKFLTNIGLGHDTVRFGSLLPVPILLGRQSNAASDAAPSL